MLQTNQTASLPLKQRLHRATVKLSQFEGVALAEQQEHSRIVEEVSAAKARLSLSEEVVRVFEALQHKAHERSVGAFERLLTAILNDVLPEEGKVRLIPQYKNNATWLDILLEKDEALEDVLDGNGGAVTNVICAGLRFAALSRTGNRRLMILDEPDCWLKPDKVPAFVRVISQVSHHAKTQTFFITHHDKGLFEGEVNLVKFFEDDSGKVVAQGIQPLVHSWEDDETPGIRGIELINFRRHEHTIIPCYPGATAFIGENNLGKSTAIVSSFKALAYNESSDSMIRHGCDEARIIFHLEKGLRLEWSRSKKRSPSVIYRLFEKGNIAPIQEGRPKVRNQAPDWVISLLGITPVDDLDIQIGNQKSPVFLLNDSASKRAQILSVGRESGHLKGLMKYYEEIKSSDREKVKFGEARSARLAYRMTIAAPLPSLNEKLAELVIESDGMLDSLDKQEVLESLMARLTRAKECLKALEAENDALNAIPELPEMANISVLETLIPTLEKGAKLPLTSAIPHLPDVPTLAELETILLLGQKISKATASVAVLSALPETVPSAPELAVIAPVEETIAKIQGKIAQVSATTLELTAMSVEYEREQDNAKKLRESLGGECPLCGGVLPENGVSHHHA